MIQSIELGPFSEGVNLADNPLKLNDRELLECYNYRIDTRGDFHKRPGHSNYGSTPAKVNGDNIVNLLVRYYKADGTKQLIAAAGGKIRKGNDVTGAWTDIPIDGNGANSMSSSNLADWFIYKDRLYVVDGVKPHRYDGTDDLYTGHYSYPAPTLVAGAGGGLTAGATYKYRVASVTSDMGEGPYGAEASVALGGSQNRVTLSNMNAPAAKYSETHKKIYRTLANGSTFFYLTTLTTGTTSYIDDIPDSQLTVAYIPVHKPPDTARFCLVGHDDRAYYCGMSAVGTQSLVEVSEVGFPDRILDTNSFFTVAANDGDKITGMGLSPGGIIFTKKRSIWLSRGFGYGLINIAPREKRGHSVGCTAPFSIVATPAGLIFVSQFGEVYRFDGTNLHEIGYKIAPQLRYMNESAMNRVIACYHDYRYILTYDHRGLKGYNWRTLEYDIRTQKWEGPHDNLDYYTPSYYAVYDGQFDKGELAWGEAKAANGSYVRIRDEFSKTDRGNKFHSRVKAPPKALSGLGEVKSTKAFVHGFFSVDSAPRVTHISETGTRSEIALKSQGVHSPVKFNTGAKFNQGNKFGGKISQILEGNIPISARSRMPMYEFSDGAGTEGDMTEFRILVEALPLTK